MRRTTESRPTFCPSCGKSFPTAGPRRLCDECGAGLLDRGYCPVCEDFINAEVGRLCPKHDLVLEAGPEAFAPRDVEGPWVEVARFDDAVACHPPRIRLEAEGIPTTVEGELAGSKSIHAAFSGGVVLRVPEKLAADARVILSQKWSDDAKALGIEDEDDWDDLDEDFPPASAAAEAEEHGPPRRSNALLYFLLAASFAASLASMWLAS